MNRSNMLKVKTIFFSTDEQKSVLLQLIEQVTKTLNRIRTIDTEYHEFRSQVLKREQSFPVKYPTGFPLSFSLDVDQ